MPNCRSIRAHLSHDPAAILPERGLPLAECEHDLETLDRGIGGLQRFEPAYRPDPLLEFVMPYPNV